MKKRNKLMKKHFKTTNGKENHKMEQLIKEDNEQAIERAKLVVSLENEGYSEPIVIVTPNTSTKRKVRFRTTKVDHTIRVDYDYALVTTLFLGGRSLFYHQSSIDYLIGAVESDVAYEVGYTDIVKVETFIGYDNPNNPKLRVVMLTLGLANATTITIPLRNHYIFDKTEKNEILTEKEQYIIHTIKKAIRTVK